jgi:hypothetical protein
MIRTHDDCMDDMGGCNIFWLVCIALVGIEPR